MRTFSKQINLSIECTKLPYTTDPQDHI